MILLRFQSGQLRNLGSTRLATLTAQHPGAALKMTQNITRELSTRVRYASDLPSDNSARARSGWKKGGSLFAMSRF